jgi:transposase
MIVGIYTTGAISRLCSASLCLRPGRRLCREGQEVSLQKSGRLDRQEGRDQPGRELRQRIRYFYEGQAECRTQKRPRRARLLSDRGFDADWIRAFVTERGAWANIPPKRNRKDPICFSPYLYRDRNLVERFFNKIMQCRRVATRYDKLAANYLAFVKLACIRLWLRVYECTA